MDAIQFILNYQYYIIEIKSVIKPDLLLIIDELGSLDPHDLVAPDSWFPNESAARGYVWSLFLKEVTKR